MTGIPGMIQNFLWWLTQGMLNLIDQVMDGIITIAKAVSGILEMDAVEGLYQSAMIIGGTMIAIYFVWNVLKLLTEFDYQDIPWLKLIKDVALAGLFIIAIPIIFEVVLKMTDAVLVGVQQMGGGLTQSIGDTLLSVSITSSELPNAQACADAILSAPADSPMNWHNPDFTVAQPCLSDGAWISDYIQYWILWIFGAIYLTLLLICSVTAAVNSMYLMVFYIIAPIWAFDLLTEDKQRFKTWKQYTLFYTFATGLMIFTLNLGLMFVQGFMTQTNDNTQWFIMLPMMAGTLIFALTGGKILGQFFGSDASSAAGFQAITTMLATGNSVVSSPGKALGAVGGAATGVAAGVAGVAGVTAMASGGFKQGASGASGAGTKVMGGVEGAGKAMFNAAAGSESAGRVAGAFTNTQTSGQNRGNRNGGFSENFTSNNLASPSGGVNQTASRASEAATEFMKASPGGPK